MPSRSTWRELVRVQPKLNRRLREAVRDGRPLVCSALNPEQLACSNDEQHVIPAAWIRDLLRGCAGQDLDPLGVRVVGARITGELDLDSVECKVGLALRGCWLDRQMTVRGARLPSLLLSGSYLRALVADRLQVAGNVELEQLHVSAHRKEGAVRLLGAQIDGDLLCDGARLTNQDGPALNAEAMEVKGKASLCNLFSATGGSDDGAVRLRSAHVRGRVLFTGAHLRNQKGPALHAARLQVDSTMQLDSLTATGCSEDGAVRLRNARIGGRLYCRNAQLTNQDGPGLSAARVEVEGSVHLERLCATGRGEDGAVRLRNARIGGSLYCIDAQLTSQDGPGLGAARMQVEGSVHLEGLRATSTGRDGAVRLRYARIGGNLECSGTRLTNQDGPALDARELEVGEAVMLRDRFHATGHSVRSTVRLRGASIGTRLEFGEELCNTGDGPALDLRSVSVRNLCLPREAINCPAEDSSRQQATHKPLLLDGLTYTTIPEPCRDLDQWLSLLGDCTSYAAQPYQQLASVYRAVGEEAKARKILIKQQDDLQARGGELLGGRWSRARHWLLGKTIGYGYRTWPAFLGLAVVLILAMFLGLLAGRLHDDGRLVAAHTDRAAPLMVGTACSTAEQISLGLERALPLLIGNTGIGDRCALDSNSIAGQVITAFGWILQLAAWAFATLAIVGFTGLVRKT